MVALIKLKNVNLASKLDGRQIVELRLDWDIGGREYFWKEATVNHFHIITNMEYIIDIYNDRISLIFLAFHA